MYTTQLGDTWDGIAFRLYGKEEYAKQLIDLNRKYCHIVIFPAGIELEVLERTPMATDSQLPPWKR